MLIHKLYEFSLNKEDILNFKQAHIWHLYKRAETWSLLVARPDPDVGEAATQSQILSELSDWPDQET